MIEIENISKIYPSRSNNGSIIALDNISLKIDDKEFVILAGKSGAGKTTLLKLILREESPTKGKILFYNQDINEIKKSQLPELRKRIGTVFQDYKLFESKTAYENIAYVMEVMGISEEEIQRDVPQVLKIVGLADRINSFPKELSGGEKQRVAIARALIHRPDVIMADEPTGNLDPYHTHDIIELLEKIHEVGTTVILATHDKGVINKLRKRVITLEGGKIIKDDKKGRFIL